MKQEPSAPPIPYFRPLSLAEALTLKATKPVRILAGGTDFYPALRDQPVTFPVLDISAIHDLRHIRKEPGYWSIGANATWRDIQDAALPACFTGLKQAAREVGSLQIQNRATVVGNICNASPAADGVPPLLTLDADVEISSCTSRRRKKLLDFIHGNRKTNIRSDEIITRILIPEASCTGNASFVKLGARKYLVISIAMVAVRGAMSNGKFTDIAISVGSCSEVAKRLRRLEQSLIGCSLHDVARRVSGPPAFDGLKPIDDVRAPAIYRMDAAAELVSRAIRNCFNGTSHVH